MTSHGSLQKAPVAQCPLKYKHLVPISIRKCIPRKPWCPFYIEAQIDNLPPMFTFSCNCILFTLTHIL